MKKVIAMLLSGLLIIGSTVGVMAAEVDIEGDSIIVNGDIASSYTSHDSFGIFQTEDQQNPDIYQGNSLEINGSVTSYSSGPSLIVRGEEKSVDVTGDVHGRDGQTLYSVGVEASDGASVNVDGNVTSEGWNAINASNGASVSVGGNATSEGWDAIVASNGGKVTVKGDVSGGLEGIRFADTPNVSVSDPVGSTVIVEGTVSGSSGVAIGYYGNNPDSTAIVYKTEGRVVSYDSYDPNSNATDATNRVFYIIKKESDDIGMSGTIQKSGYDTAHANDVIRVTVASGYEASTTAGTIVKNADGSFSVTIPAGGGVTISAIKAAIKQMENNNVESIVIPTTSNETEPSSTTSSSSNPASTEPSVTAPVLVGNVLSAKIDASSMSENEYTSRVVNMISQVPIGGTLSLDVTNTAYLNQQIISALKARSDVSVSLNVKFNGLDYSIVIPAGFDLNKFIGPDGKIDFDILLKTFGVKAI